MWAPSIDSPWNHLNSSNVALVFQTSPLNVKLRFWCISFPTIFQPSFHVKRDKNWNVHVNPIDNLKMFGLFPHTFNVLNHLPHLCLLCKCGWVAKYLSSKNVLRLQMMGRSTGYRGETLLPGSCTFSFQILHLLPWRAPNWQQVLMPCSSLWCLSPLQFLMLF